MTRNGRSILLTALLALILVYLFSIVGYLFFKADFLLEVDPLPNDTALPGGRLRGQGPPTDPHGGHGAPSRWGLPGPGREPEHRPVLRIQGAGGGVSRSRH